MLLTTFLVSTLGNKGNAEQRNAAEPSVIPEVEEVNKKSFMLTLIHKLHHS